MQIIQRCAGIHQNGVSLRSLLSGEDRARHLRVLLRLAAAKILFAAGLQTEVFRANLIGFIPTVTNLAHGRR